MSINKDLDKFMNDLPEDRGGIVGVYGTKDKKMYFACNYDPDSFNFNNPEALKLIVSDIVNQMVVGKET